MTKNAGDLKFQSEHHQWEMNSDRKTEEINVKSLGSENANFKKLDDGRQHDGFGIVNIHHNHVNAKDVYELEPIKIIPARVGSGFDTMVVPPRAPKAPTNLQPIVCTNRTFSFRW